MKTLNKIRGFTKKSFRVPDGWVLEIEQDDGLLTKQGGENSGGHHSFEEVRDGQVEGWTLTQVQGVEEDPVPGADEPYRKPEAQLQEELWVVNMRLDMALTSQINEEELGGPEMFSALKDELREEIASRGVLDVPIMELVEATETYRNHYFPYDKVLECEAAAEYSWSKEYKKQLDEKIEGADDITSGGILKQAGFLVSDIETLYDELRRTGAPEWAREKFGGNADFVERLDELFSPLDKFYERVGEIEEPFGDAEASELDKKIKRIAANKSVADFSAGANLVREIVDKYRNPENLQRAFAMVYKNAIEPNTPVKGESTVGDTVAFHLLRRKWTKAVNDSISSQEESMESMQTAHDWLDEKNKESVDPVSHPMVLAGLTAVASHLHPRLAQLTFTDSLTLYENNGSGRAYYDTETGEAYVYKDETPRETTVHEIGHAVEMFGALSVDAARWRMERTLQDEWTEIYEGTDEIGKKDNFYTHYVGKKYEHVTNQGLPTEVISTGLERMVKEPMTFAAEDPEHFKFIAALRTNPKVVKN